MEEVNRPNDLKWLIVLYVFYLLFYIWGFYFLLIEDIDVFSTEILIAFSPILVLILAMIGVWKLKKWGFYLAILFSMIISINSIIDGNFVAPVVQAIILYFLYRWRAYFK